MKDCIITGALWVPRHCRFKEFCRRIMRAAGIYILSGVGGAFFLLSMRVSLFASLICLMVVTSFVLVLSSSFRLTARRLIYFVSKDKSNMHYWVGVGAVASTCIGAWIGIGLGRSQVKPKISELQYELQQRDAEIERLQNSMVHMEKQLPRQKVESRSVPQSIDSLKVGSAEGFRFELRECQDSSRGLLCELSILNLAEDRVLSLVAMPASDLDRGISCYSMAIDYEGNELLASKVSLGENGGELKGWTAYKLTSGVQTQAIILFEGLHPKGELHLLEVCGFSKESLSVRFHNIPVAR